MSHIRNAVREAVAAKLTPLGYPVYENRLYALQPADLPCLVVYTQSDRIDRTKQGNGQVFQNREMTVHVVAAAGLLNDVEDKLDQMAAEIEIALAADRKLGGAVRDSGPTGIETAFQIDGETPHGALRLTYNATATTVEGEPSSGF